MAFEGIQPRDINEEALVDLLTGQVPEGKTIDYKQELPGNSDAARKDFLADLSSFANAAGGYIVFGMAEGDGLPTDLAGLAGEIDQGVLRLESMARDGIRPAIPGLEFVRVALANGRAAVVASIPKSWIAPHQVVFQKDYRFYTRGSAGKQHVDVDELRRIVLFSQEAGERIRQFRAGRVAAVMSGDTPIQIEARAKQVLHFVPLNAFGTGVSVDLSTLAKEPGPFIRTMNRGGSQRHNVDGLLAFSQVGQTNDAYAQVYRNGVLEIVVALDEWNPRGKLVLPSDSFEGDVIAQSQAAFNILRRVAVPPPVVVMLSFTGIKGWEMGVADRWSMRRQGGFDRDPLLIPELVLQALDTQNVAGTIKPLIDGTWNASGFEGSTNFDNEGNWKVRS